MEKRSPHQMSFFNKNKKALKTLSVIGVVITILLMSYFLYIDLFNHPEIIQAKLESTGAFAPLVYFVGFILNTIYPLIPGGLGNVVGYAVFSPLWAFILSFSANLIGSMILFHLAKRFGKPILYAFFKPESINKALAYLEKWRIERIMALVFIIPGLPDDIFTMIAGFSRISYKRILLLQLIFKPITMFLYMAGIHNLLSLFSNLLH